MAYQLTADDKKIASQLANSGDYLSQSKYFVKPDAPKQKKTNIFESLLPTLGSVGGGILGTLIAPGVGTAIGGALGGGLGKVGQNAAEGNDLSSGVLGETALGSLGGIGKAFQASKGAVNALRAGEGVADAAKVARYGTQGAQALSNSSKAGQSLGLDALVASKANTAASPLSKLSAGLEERGAKTLASQSQGLSGRLATEAPDVFKTMNKYGYKNINDFNDLASKVTTGDGALNLEKINVLANAPKTANLGTWSSDASRSLNTTVGITPADKKAITSALRQTEENLQKQMSGRLGSSTATKVGEIHPEDAYRAAQDLQSQAYSSLGNKTYANALPPQQAKFDVLNKAATDLKEKAYKTVGNEAITPASRQNIIEDLRSRGVDSPALIKEIQTAKTIPELNKIESQFTKASQIAQQSSDAGRKGLGSQVGSLRNATVGGVVMDAASKPISRIGGGTMLKTSGLLNKIGGATPDSVGGLALQTGRKMGMAQAPIRLAQLLGGDQAGANPDPSQLDPTQMQQGLDPSMGSDLSSSLGLGGVQQQQGGYSLDQLFNDIQADASQTGGKNADTLLKLYQLSNPENKTKQKTASVKEYSQANSALSGLDQLAQMLQSDPSLLSKSAVPGQDLPIVGGLISNAAGTGQYNATANNVLNSLSRLNTGAAMTKDEEAFYKRMLPAAGDSDQTIQAKLGQLQQAFEPYINGY